MNTRTGITGEQLANSLHALGLSFIMGGAKDKNSLHKHPARLIAALAESDEARLRLAIIPLLLEHPEFAAQVGEAMRNIHPSARITLQCYYSAALFLQQIHRPRLTALLGEKQLLPDLFSHDMSLPATGDPEMNLRLLAERHRALSSEQINWLGTYRHAAQRWLDHLERTMR